MRQSQYFINTLRENPADAEVASHTLMLRAGMIRKVAAGIYSYMPLGLRVMRKVEEIVRQSMNEAGAIELLMSAVQPGELWEESKRWGYYGKELLRFKDRHNRDFCIGPTHEEVITDIVRGVIKSYKQLPLNLYQIQTKFRDEVRPRFGLMRGREFIMKDAYSFDIDDAGAEVSYKKMYEAYRNVFERCGLLYKVVDADSGSIGGSFSHEFMVLADTGEDEVISCNTCDYSANMEKALVVDADNINSTEAEQKAEEVETPNMHTAVEVAEFLGTDLKRVVKTMIVKLEGVKDEKGKDIDKLVAVVVAGDREVNLAKVKSLLGATVADFATPEEVYEAVNCKIGSLGVCNMPLEVYADNELKYLKNIVIGANKEGYHIKNINAGADYTPTMFADIRNANEGDKCPECEKGHFVITRGIEVGHIFKLGTKYSEAMGAKALDKNGKAITLAMGCYGIGIGRTAASAIEQNHDEKGMVWPRAIAPFEVVVIPINTNDDDVILIADETYKGLMNLGIDTIIDDRNERAGVKLNDADLIGYPIRVSVGRKTLADGMIEVHVRKTGETILVAPAEVYGKVQELLAGL